MSSMENMVCETDIICTTDAYLREMKAKVICLKKDGVVLDRTIFYPRGGGQPEDRGIIISSEGKEFELSGLERREGELIHKVDTGLLEGELVELRIDWEYRYQLMRHHTALHILSAVVNKRFDETKVTGGNIYQDRARLDFDLPQFNKVVALEVVDELNKIIAEDHDVSISFMPREEAEKVPELFRTTVILPKSIKEFRIVKIGNVDLQADGGLHVKSSAEIGRVKLVKTDNKGKGRKRVTIAIES